MTQDLRWLFVGFSFIRLALMAARLFVRLQAFIRGSSWGGSIILTKVGKQSEASLTLLSLALFRRSPNFFFRMFQSLCSYAQRKIGSKQLRSERKGSRRRRLRQSSAWTSFQSSRDQYPEKFSAFCFVQNLFWRCFAAAVVIRETAITATTLLLLGETVTANST